MKKLSFALLMVFLLLGAPPQARATEEKYYVPPSQFNAVLQVMDQGFLNVFGMFQGGTGAFSFDTDGKSISHVRVAVDAASLMVPNPSAARDLLTLLDVRQYPEISFMATAPAEFKDGKAEIKGTLSLHGQKKPATFEGTLNHVGNAPERDEGSAVGLSLRGVFKRADFAMGDEPEIPGRFGDTITLMIEMQALRQ